MVPLQCLFCDQPNPGESKFCNECGTPLHFKPCPQCDGINGRFATTCYRCGGDFAVVQGPASAAEPAEPASETSALAAFAAIRTLAQGFRRGDDAAPAAPIPAADNLPGDAPADDAMASPPPPVAASRRGPRVPRTVIALLLLASAIAVPAYQVYIDREPGMTQSISVTPEPGLIVANAAFPDAASPDAASPSVPPVGDAPAPRLQAAANAKAGVVVSINPRADSAGIPMETDAGSPTPQVNPTMAGEAALDRMPGAADAMSAAEPDEDAEGRPVTGAGNGSVTDAATTLMPATPAAVMVPPDSPEVARPARQRGKVNGSATSPGQRGAQNAPGSRNGPAATARPVPDGGKEPLTPISVLHALRDALAAPPARLQQAVLQTRLAAAPPLAAARSGREAVDATRDAPTICQEVIATLTNCDLKTLPKGN